MQLPSASTNCWKRLAYCSILYRSHKCDSCGCQHLKQHQSGLLNKQTKKWDQVLQRVIRDFCRTVSQRLQQVVDS